MASIEDDRRYVIEQWQYLFGRMPTAAEVNHNVGELQKGLPRTQFMAFMEKLGARDAIIRIYQQVLGRMPASHEINGNMEKFAAGTMTRQLLTQRLSGSVEALLREPTPAEDPADKDAHEYLKGVLDSYGLSSLGDWAWQQIQEGYSTDRILQNLRETGEYKQRFKGLTLRREAGFNAISEGEYIAYETAVRQMMRAAGMPADFYDSPDDFANFIGRDVSASEMQARIDQGYLAASQAPPEVRDQLRSLYGITEGQLAAFFLDPDRALPLLQRQLGAAQASGAAVMSGYGALSQGEAENLAALGVDEGQARQGFGALVESRELFGGLPGMGEEAISRDTQQAAVFGGDAQAMEQIKRRASERVSAGSGAQSFTIGQDGVTGLGVG